ncbi:hypothetical protein [Variovorax sp. GT1P44]|uniref:hypothetical protein n=1 Tax=Variovorax sp. GT1P44 TaxID=3443742 RepID=UPI003F48B830
MDTYSANPSLSPPGVARVTDLSTRDVAVSSGSGVSWGAIFAGAAGAAALSLVLLLLGTGLGLSAASPWASRGASAAALGFASILWLSFTQIAASGMGGYLAGRLRTKWAGAHTDEVYFRDTAHGFLAWAVATLLSAALLASAVGSIVGAGAQAGATAAGGAATAAAGTAAGAAGAAGASASDSSGGPVGYFIDSLFRRDAGAATGSPAPNDGTAAAAPGAPADTSGTPERSNAATTAEVSRIFMNGIRTGALPAADTTYVARVVAQRTGMSQQDAEKRVNDTYAKAQAALNDAKTKAQEAADAARKASAYASLWLVVSMLIGAFVASFAATYGGRRRDL